MLFLPESAETIMTSKAEQGLGVTSLTTFATFRYENRVCVGLTENIPQKAAGIRTEPPFGIIQLIAIAYE